MRRLRPYLAHVLIILLFVGWFSYPGWRYYDYYSNWMENYAYPASFSGPNDPPWGFWFW